MTKEKFKQNHPKTYESLQSHMQSIVMLLKKSEEMNFVLQKKLKNPNRSLKKRMKDQGKVKELAAFVMNLSGRGDRIYKILNELEENKIKKGKKNAAKISEVSPVPTEEAGLGLAETSKGRAN